MTDIVFSAETSQNKYDFIIYDVEKDIAKEYSVGIYNSGTMFKDGEPMPPTYNIQIQKAARARKFRFIKTEGIPKDVYSCEGLLNSALLCYSLDL